MSTTTVMPPGPAWVGSDARRGAGLVLFMVCSAIFMLMLDATVVSATLADIRTDFNTSIDGLQWVIDAYAIPLAGVLLTFATVGDRYGRKRMFVLGMAVFTASSLALTLSDTILQLNILRAVQGVGAAMLFATALPLLSVAFPDSAKRAKAIGIYGAVMAGASVAGPVLGGLLVTQFGWRSVFTINIPIGLVIIAIAVLRMPESPRTPERRTDWLGSLLLTGGLVAGVYCMTRGNALGWGSATSVTLAALAIALLVLFMVWQFRTAHPLFDAEEAWIRRYRNRFRRPHGDADGGLQLSRAVPHQHPRLHPAANGSAAAADQHRRVGDGTAGGDLRQADPDSDRAARDHGPRCSGHGADQRLRAR
ncbi:MFS transporter [Nocardia colli]|uniref:MFS transporter n=1 Tax=Nocardia colli TaxID=2545717 RepID=A0A5N0EKM3_9NOCA|nr:MFS transporter [Nocardia colli]